MIERGTSWLTTFWTLMPACLPADLTQNTAKTQLPQRQGQDYLDAHNGVALGVRTVSSTEERLAVRSHVPQPEEPPHHRLCVLEKPVRDDYAALLSMVIMPMLVLVLTLRRAA